MKPSRISALVVTSLLVASLTGPAAGAGPAPKGSDAVSLQIAGGRVSVATSTLAIAAITSQGTPLTVSGPAVEDLGPAEDVQQGGNRASWTLPAKHLAVEAVSRAGRLEIVIRSNVDQSLSWPVTGTDPAVRTLQIPRGEGLSVPVGDPLWNSTGVWGSGGAGLDGVDMPLVGDLNLPFWGYSTGRGGVSYLSPTDIDTSLWFASRNGRLQTTAVHDFSARQETRDFMVAFALTGGSPIAAAKDYRQWLIQHHQLRTLQEKAQTSPEINKLRGAFHAYLWGGGRTAAAIDKLKAAGVSRMLLSWDADAHPMPADAIQAAKRDGYLAGPYDTWDNAQPPESADAPTSAWPSPVWDQACVRNADGTVVSGFGGRGCYLSSQALAQAEPNHHYLADRIAAMTADHPNAYFMDVDAAGEFFTDYSAAHPMNEKQDRENRLERMGWLSERYHLVLGSEKAGGWSNSVVAFSHGSASVNMNSYWPFTHTPEWGSWSPAERPAFFFKPATMPDALRTAMWDPKYRAPLYSAVLHDSIVNLDRWELSYYKVNGVQQDRALLAMVSANPLNFVLDAGVITQRGAEIARLQRAFQPLHEATFNLPVTGFRYLGQGTDVQQSTFGAGAATVTANFGAQAFHGLPGKCARITISGQPTRQFCP
ncbi:hypothetical protein JOF29_002695 [Kribbella aluminosa]|uniref:Glycosyl hydrolase family 101 n=1 Tax=Kribbella aluminosa TaxID=416017 RepID=A0ABS4UIZ3_9ACTN|nr:glycoside hydrolase [Kribbella aluminosa]MBP2351612.1 hypothetical protein [Kribbella aluminosa]